MLKKVVIGALLLVIVAGIGWVLSGRAAATVSGAAQATATPLPAVRASTQVIADARVVPVQSAALSLPTGGIVATLLVEEGEVVRAGAPLLRLASARQEAAVAQAKAGVAQAKAGVAQAEAGVAQAEAGVQRATARLAELRAGARPEEIAAAQASLDAAQAQLARVQQGARAEDIQAAQANVAAAQASLRQAQQGATEQQLIAARAELANAEAALQQAQAAYDRVAGNADIGMRPESLQLQQATNSYNAAKARYDDLASGGTESAISAAQAQVQQAQAALNSLRAGARPAEISAAQAEIRRAQAQLDLLRAGTRSESIEASEADVASAEAALLSARASLTAAKAMLASAEATLEQAEVALAEMELRAPFAGTVARVDAKVGEQVLPGSPIVQLADLSAWQIETDDLTELQVVRLKEGDPVSITFDALPDLEFSGTVHRIRSIGENKQGDITYTVIVTPDTQDERLRWNMTAIVDIEAK